MIVLNLKLDILLFKVNWCDVFMVGIVGVVMIVVFVIVIVSKMNLCWIFGEGDYEFEFIYDWVWLFDCYYW